MYPMLNSSRAEFVYFWIDVQGIYLEILYRVINIVACLEGPPN